MVGRRFSWLAGWSLLLLATAQCGWAAKPPGVDPLFETEDVLEITLTGPLNRLARDRSPTPEPRQASLKYTDAAGSEVDLSVVLEPRGKSRRDRAVCTFPPLWVEFDKEQVKGTLFRKQDKLKLVTHCRSPESFQDYVIKEYLAYRIFNELSEASFAARLVRVNFVEEGKTGKPLTRYGFFIEHKKRLAKRLDTDIVELTDRIPVASLDEAHTAIADLFQYMVSNTDYSFIAPPENEICCHNTVLFAADGGKYLPIPYDFDRTGLVDPPNGKPDENLGQRNFRDRMFRGFCHGEQHMQAALQRTREARPVIEQLIAGQNDLSPRSRQRALDFIGSYYETIEDDNRRGRELRCRSVR